MKVTFLIAASLIATAAIAQDTTPAPAPAPMDMSAAPAPMTNASPPASTVAPPAPDTSSYPPCSRTVHDRCVQTHEMARKSRGHR